MSRSSWWSELYASVTTEVESLRLQSGLRDFGNNTRVTIACDNQGVVDHTARQGLGLAKHVHTTHLWLQAAFDEGRLDVVEMSTERNPADLVHEASTVQPHRRVVQTRWSRIRPRHVSTIVRVYQTVEAMHHEVSYRFTKNPDTLATSHCQQCCGRSENSQRELPRSKEQRRSSVLLWMCRLMSSCLPNFELQSEYGSRCVERSEPHTEECTRSGARISTEGVC